MVIGECGLLFRGGNIYAVPFATASGESLEFHEEFGIL